MPGCWNSSTRSTQSALQAIGEVRTIAQNLRPINLDRLGLAAAIEEMVEKASGAAGVDFSADVGRRGWRAARPTVKSSSIGSSRRASTTSSSTPAPRVPASRSGARMALLRITVRDNGRGFKERSAGGDRLGERLRAGAGRHRRARADAGRHACHRLHAGTGHDGDRADSASAVERRCHATATDIRVVIADDHPIFRKGLREILAADRELADRRRSRGWRAGAGSDSDDQPARRRARRRHAAQERARRRRRGASAGSRRRASSF